MPPRPRRQKPWRTTATHGKLQGLGIGRVGTPRWSAAWTASKMATLGGQAAHGLPAGKLSAALGWQPTIGRAAHGARRPLRQAVRGMAAARGQQ